MRLPGPDCPTADGPPAHAPWAGLEGQPDAQKNRALWEATTPGWRVVDYYETNAARFLIISQIRNRIDVH